MRAYFLDLLSHKSTSEHASTLDDMTRRCLSSASIAFPLLPILRHSSISESAMRHNMFEMPNKVSPPAFRAFFTVCMKEVNCSGDVWLYVCSSSLYVMIAALNRSKFNDY